MPENFFIEKKRSDCYIFYRGVIDILPLMRASARVSRLNHFVRESNFMHCVLIPDVINHAAKTGMRGEAFE